MTVASCTLAVVVRYHTTLLVISLLPAVLGAGLCGYTISVLRVLVHHEKTARILGATMEPVERVASLARFMKAWGLPAPLAERRPIIAAVVVGISTVTAALITVLAALID